MPEPSPNDTAHAEANRMPWLGIFEVRRELEPHANIEDGFDLSIEHELARAAETGSLDALQRSLRQWLETALFADNIERLADLDIDGRGRRIKELVAAWLARRPATRWRPPTAGAAQDTHDRVQWAVRITTKNGAVLSPPYATKQQAQEHIAHIHEVRAADGRDRTGVELVWRRMHPWSTGEPDPAGHCG